MLLPFGFGGTLVSEAGETMLSDLVLKSSILTNVKAIDWKDAIRQAASPLVSEGRIEARYVDAIIESALKNGPYFVLVPHIALPHARPEEGALSDAIGISVLEKPVEFGSESNDPVKYLFTLSATSNDNHLDALAQLASLFEDEMFFKLLDTHPQPEEVIDYIGKL